MKNVLFIGLLLIIPVITFAQSEKEPPIDKRLYEVFEVDFLKRMQKETPAMLEYYNFFLEYAYNIQTLEKNKTSTYSEITIEDLDNVNILKVINDQKLKRDYNNQSIYKIADTNQLLILIAEKELAKKFNQHTGRTH